MDAIGTHIIFNCVSPKKTVYISENFKHVDISYIYFVLKTVNAKCTIHVVINIKIKLTSDHILHFNINIYFVAIKFF